MACFAKKAHMPMRTCRPSSWPSSTWVSDVHLLDDELFLHPCWYVHLRHHQRRVIDVACCNEPNFLSIPTKFCSFIYKTWGTQCQYPFWRHPSPWRRSSFSSLSARHSMRTAARSVSFRTDTFCRVAISHPSVAARGRWSAWTRCTPGSGRTSSTATWPPRWSRLTVRATWMFRIWTDFARGARCGRV